MFYNTLFVIPTCVVLLCMIIFSNYYSYDFSSYSINVKESSTSTTTTLFIVVLSALLFGIIEICAIASAGMLTCLGKYGFSMYSSMKKSLQIFRHIPELCLRLRKIQKTYERKNKQSENQNYKIRKRNA